MKEFLSGAFRYHARLFLRVRFAGLLLLKGRDNISSGNEKYAQKLKTYTGHAPYWAQTLVPDFYRSNISMRDLIRETDLPFKPIPELSREALEKRSELLYGIAKRIWEVSPSTDIECSPSHSE